MAEVGRISGPLLKSNLVRNGIDIWFRNTTKSPHLLYLEVTNGRIGVNTSSPTQPLEINGTTQTTNLITDFIATPGYEISNNTIRVLSGDIYLDAADAIVMANMENGTIRISDNIISTIVSNADIDLYPNNGGHVQTGTRIVNDLEVFGNLHTPNNITFEGTITLGDQDTDNVVFNSDITSDIIPTDNTRSLGRTDKRWDQLYTYFVNGQTVTVDGLDVGQIDFNTRLGGQLYVAVTGNDAAHGDHPMAPFATIARALQAAEASGNQPFEIRVSPGEYQEALPLVVPPNVSIVGENIRNCVVTPDTSSQSEDVFHLSNNNTIANLTIKNHYYDNINNTGYAFRFAPNVIITERSPYIQNVTVITQETSPGAADAGRGAWIDGSELNSSSIEASMLFHSCTFITPNADVINMTNGVRVEWLNSFTYYANRGLYAFRGVTGRTSYDGSTVEYGAELRSIGSANVYGNYGAVADGVGTLMYLIQHNFGYVGAGTDNDNNPTNAIQANEVVELNSGQIHYVTTDHLGNFRVGDNFFVDLESGNTSISINTAEIESLSGLVINTAGDTTYIDGTNINTGNLNINSNHIESTVGDLILKGGTGVINLTDNTTVNGKVIIRDNFSFGGTLNLAGDQTIDRVDFNVQFEQNFKPHQNLTFSLGTPSKQWNNVYLNQAQVGDLTINDNFITTNVSNANLELRANNLANIYVLNNNVQVDNNFTVSSLSTLKNTNITGIISQTGNILLDGDLSISEALTIDNVKIHDNYITTLDSNSNLELRAAGAGRIVIQNNVDITNNINVVKTTTLKDSYFSYEYGSELVTNGTFNTNLTGWTAAGGGTATVVAGTMYINAATAARNMSQAITVEAGKTYNFSIDVVSATLDTPDPADEYYIRIFEPGVGTLLEWTDATIEGNTPITLTGSFIPTTTLINIIIRASNSIVQVDNVTIIEDIGLVENITPVQVNINGTLTQVGNLTQTGNITQTGDTDITGGVTVSSDFTGSNIIIDNNVIRNYREDLRLDTSDPYNPLSLTQIIREMAVNSVTEADYPDQTEKNLITFLRNGTTAASDYGYSYVDVDQSGTTTSSDALAWLQYVANGTSGNAAKDAFIFDKIELLLEDEYANPGKYNSLLFLGDYYRADLILEAAGTGNISMPANDVRISNNASAGSIISNDITVTQELEAVEFITTTDNIDIDDNFISILSADTNLELRAVRNIVIPGNNVTIEQDLTVNSNTDVDYLNVVGDITHTGNRNQLGDLNVIGTVTVSTSNIQSEIQFDDILFNDNYIETQESNSSLELIANGTGIIIIPENNVDVNTNISLGSLDAANINVQSSLEAEVFELSSDITIFDNVIETTNSNSNIELRTVNSKIIIETLRFNSDTIESTPTVNLTANNNLIINANAALKIPSGTTIQRQPGNSRIRFNTSDNVFESSNNGANITFNGVYSSNRQTSMLADPTTNVINFTIAGINVGNLTNTGLTIHGIDTDDISIQDNVIRTDITNSNLELRADGTGKLEINDIIISENIIENTSDSALTISSTLYGRIKFSSPIGIAIPYGTTAEQPASPEIGTSRWNTDLDVLEVWDGSTFITAAGSSATISEAEMQDLILEYTLIFG